MNPADQDNLKLSKSNLISSKTIPISKEYTMGKTLGSGAFGIRSFGHSQSDKANKSCKSSKEVRTRYGTVIKRSRNSFQTEST